MKNLWDFLDLLEVVTKTFFGIIIVGFVALAIYVEYINYTDPHYETITVTKTTLGLSSQQSSYLVYTKDEVYKIQDLFWVGFFETSDVYNHIQIGCTHRVKVRGRRVPFFSAYKNIVAVEDYPKTSNP